VKSGPSIADSGSFSAARIAGPTWDRLHANQSTGFPASPSTVCVTCPVNPLGPSPLGEPYWSAPHESQTPIVTACFIITMWLCFLSIVAHCTQVNIHA